MEARPTVRRRFSQAERDGFLTAYRKSGLTQRAFATHAGISLASLTLWLRRQKRRHQRPEFVEVPRALSSASAVAYKMEFPGGLKLDIPHGFFMAEVEQLCRIARQL